MANTTIHLQSGAITNTFGSRAPTTQFKIIEKYLQTSSDPRDAAADLVSCINDGSCLQALPESELRVEEYVFTLFGEIIHIATQIPWDHQWHESLLLLLVNIQKQPAPPTEVCMEFEVPGYGEFRWDLLPGYLFLLGDLWSYKDRASPDSRRSGMKDCWSLQEWRNLNSFLAISVAEQGGRCDGACILGVRLLRYTLEYAADAAQLEENIQSAALWILVAGTWLHQNRGLKLDTFQYGLEEVPDYKGPDGLSDERWKFWKGRFGELAVRSNLSEEAKAWALKAADYMAELKRTLMK